MLKNRIFRESTLNEREEFYGSEFYFKKLIEWFKKNNLPMPQLCAIDAGTESGMVKKRGWKNHIFYFYFKDLAEKIKKYLPEDIYYDRNIYKNPELRFKNLKHYNFLADKNVLGQEPVFDIDADNIRCWHKKMQNACEKCLRKAYKETMKFNGLLKEKFKKTAIVYSGRGFHIHVLDKSAFYLTKKQRENLTKKLSNFPIDPWVTNGNIELIRMPFTLNAVVSRIAMPIEGKFDWEEAIPKFLKFNNQFY